MTTKKTYTTVRFWKQRIGKGVTIAVNLMGNRYEYDHDILLRELQRRGHIGYNTKSLEERGVYSISQENAMENASVREALEPYRVA